ncbi:hypothetical protein FB451DRAFT_1492012 [Mycena latifolia]|nr:hypothetical protein FB451DRAFT_1492012 [Mycena latifolia]
MKHFSPSLLDCLRSTLKVCPHVCTDHLLRGTRVHPTLQVAGPERFTSLTTHGSWNVSSMFVVPFPLTPRCTLRSPRVLHTAYIGTSMKPACTVVVQDSAAGTGTLTMMRADGALDDACIDAGGAGARVLTLSFKGHGAEHTSKSGKSLGGAQQRLHGTRPKSCGCRCLRIDVAPLITFLIRPLYATVHARWIGALAETIPRAGEVPQPARLCVLFWIVSSRKAFPQGAPELCITSGKSGCSIKPNIRDAGRFAVQQTVPSVKSAVFALRGLVFPASGVVSPPWEDGMQAVVHQLQQGTSSAGSSEIFLSDPYAKQSPTQQSLRDAELNRSKPQVLVIISPIHPKGPLRYFSQTPTQHNLPRISVLEHPLPLEATRPLLDVFLCDFSPRHFFFLDTSAFQAAFDAHPPVAPALLHAMYLWATRLSSKAASAWHLSEAQLLTLTTNHLAHAVATPHAHTTLQIIQAAVLLSLYYLDAGRLVEGRYHCAGATSLAFSARLHQLGAAPRAPMPPFVFAPVAQDPSRGREQVDAFWSVVILNNYWVAVSGMPSSIPAGPSITTPWAPTPGEDESVGDRTDPTTLLVQASILLERTIVFSMRDSALEPDAPELWALDARLEAFRGALPTTPVPSPSPSAGPGSDEHALVTHALVGASLARLHAPHAHLGGAKCLAAAQRIATLLNGAAWDPTSPVKADPILGPLLSALADVCITHLALPTAAANLNTLLAALTALAPGSALVQQCLASTQQRYHLAHGQSASVSVSVSAFPHL